MKFVVCYLGLLEIATVIIAKLLLGGNQFYSQVGTNKTHKTSEYVVKSGAVHSNGTALYV